MIFSTNKTIVALTIVTVLSVYIQGNDCGFIKNIWNKVTNSSSSSNTSNGNNSSSRNDDLDLSIPVCGSNIFSSNKDAISPEIIFITKYPAKQKFVDANSNSSSSSSRNPNNSGRNQSGRESNQNRRNNNNQSNNNQNSNTDYSSSNFNNSYNNRTNNFEGTNNGWQSSRDRSRRQAERRDGKSLNPVTYEFRFHTENVTLSELEENGFNRDAPISFLIHGFTSGYPLQSWMTAMVESYTIDESKKTLPSAGLSSNNQNDYTSSNNYNNRERRQSDQYQQQNGRRDSSKSQTLVSHNLFIVNWNYAARGPILYPRAVSNIVPVSKYISEFINKKLIQEAGVQANHIQLVGHSLGAHLSGFVAKATTQKVGRIFGLDPAGPCFGSFSGSLYPSESRLAPDDAEEVISIHTNYGLLGIEAPVGRYSVYVEGGKNQPDCGTLSSYAWQSLSWDGPEFDKVSCSHSRAPALLTAQLSTSRQDNCQLVAYSCDSWEAFKDGHCGVCDKTIDASSKLNEDQSLSGRNSSTSSGRRPSNPVECIRIGLEWQYKDKGASNQRPRQQQRKPGQRDRNNNIDNQQYSDVNVRNLSGTNRRNQRGLFDKKDKLKPTKLYLRTSNTQPYCIYHYQVILELSSAFETKKPPMSIVLQDAKDPSISRPNRQNSNSNSASSLTSDDFGNKFDDITYTSLLTSNKKLNKVEHASLIFRSGIPDKDKDKVKSLSINYMSHVDPEVRSKLSSKLCKVATKTDEGDSSSQLGNRRVYFAPCSLKLDQQSNNNGRGPNSYQNNNNYQNTNSHQNSNSNQNTNIHQNTNSNQNNSNNNSNQNGNNNNNDSNGYQSSSYSNNQSSHNQNRPNNNQSWS